MSNHPNYPKTGRISGPWLVTEKVDGTSACIAIEPGPFGSPAISFGSRNRWLTREADNHGFYAWAVAHSGWFMGHLGVGVHYGEWFGRGIQRGYGMTERRLALFDVERYQTRLAHAVTNPGVITVPALLEARDGDEGLGWLGHMAPTSTLGPVPMEGVVLRHRVTGAVFKHLFDGQKEARPWGGKPANVIFTPFSTEPHE